MTRVVRFLAPLALASLVSGTGGCGGDDSTGPLADPDFMVGEWMAESMVVTSKANPEVSSDITELGATFTLSVQPSGRYTAILAGFGRSSSESGTLTMEGQEVVFMRQLPTPGDSRARWERAGSTVTISGDTDFDFNGDGTAEPATLRTVLVPR